MPRSKRPSFLQLESELNPYTKSEYYVLPSKPNDFYPSNNNIYSPSNSIESNYSALNTPTTPSSNFTTTPNTPSYEYLPYQTTSHLNNQTNYSSKTEQQFNYQSSSNFTTTPNTPNYEYLPYQTKSHSNNQTNYSSKTEQQFNYQPPMIDRTQFNSFQQNDFKPNNMMISNSTEFSEHQQVPDWLNESFNMNESFNYCQSTNRSNNDQDRTLTDFDENSSNQYKNIFSQNQFVDQFDDYCENDGYYDDYCPIAFKELLDLAELSYARILERTKSLRTKNSNYNLDNLPPVNTKFCKFCKNNREPRDIYLSHSTMNENGKVTCPILFQYRCDLCGSTGEDAHTRSYCPIGRTIRQTMPDINDTFEFYNKKSMIHSTDNHLYDNELNDELSDWN